MTLEDNSSALIKRRKLVRKSNSQSVTKSPNLNQIQSISAPNKDAVKSHSNAKRIYRSGEDLIQSYSSASMLKINKDTEFEQKMSQINYLKNRPPTRNDLTDVNYFFDNEEINEKEIKQKSETLRKYENSESEKKNIAKMIINKNSETEKEKLHQKFISYKTQLENDDDEPKESKSETLRNFDENSKIKKLANESENDENINSSIDGKKKKNENKKQTETKPIKNNVSKKHEDNDENDDDEDENNNFDYQEIERKKNNLKKNSRKERKEKNATNWNDDDENDIGMDNDNNEIVVTSLKNSNATQSIKKSLNMYRFKS